MNVEVLPGAHRLAREVLSSSGEECSFLSQEWHAVKGPQSLVLHRNRAGSVCNWSVGGDTGAVARMGKGGGGVAARQRGTGGGGGGDSLRAGGAAWAGTRLNRLRHPL